MFVQFNIKIEERDLDLIHRISKKRGENSADFARRSIKKEIARLGFLTKEEVKALGIKSS